jgi:addiction module RelB/DinJ family antitoxin
MAQTHDELTVCIDSDVRANAEVFFRSYGFTMSTGINALLKDVVEHGKMPIEANEPDGDYDPGLEARDPFFNRATQKELARRAKLMDAGLNCAVHELIETD